jgi:hypothetical protein
MSLPLKRMMAMSAETLKSNQKNQKLKNSQIKWIKSENSRKNSPISENNLQTLWKDWKNKPITSL